jgi:hypothetical protein
MNWLCHHISRIIMSTNLAYLQFTLSDYVSHIMVFDTNVLGPLMEHLIFS